MKWLQRLQVALVTATLLLVFLPGPAGVYGAPPPPDSEDVTVNATPAFGLPGAPTDLVVDYVNEFEVALSWTKNGEATHTMIRAEWGDCPESESDGFEVYYGTGEAFAHHVDMEATSEDICYRAWSYNDSGYSLTYAEGSTGGISMTLIAFVILALGLTTLGLTTKQMALMMSCGMAWIGLGGYELVRSESVTDINHFFGWLGIALGLVFISSPAWFNRKPTEEAPTEFEEMSNDYDKFKRSFKPPKTG